MFRAGRLKDNIIVNIERFEEHETRLPSLESGKEYLLRLGFRIDPDDSKLLSINHDAARDLIEEVSRVDRQSSSLPAAQSG